MVFRYSLPWRQQHRLIEKCNQSLIRYCSKPIENIESPAKTITEKFTEAIRAADEQRKLDHLDKISKPKTLGKPKPYHLQVVGYKPRFEFNGYLKKSNWIRYDEDRQLITSLTKEQEEYKYRKKAKYCLLLAFAGGNYYGMQLNTTLNTIEDNLIRAMVKNRWILDHHANRMYEVEFSHGSRTDRGVSAARMNVSMFLPIDVTTSIENLNQDLPSDIRVFGMKRVTQKFCARSNCTARTYSYTLPTIAFNHYNDQTEMQNYRIDSDRLQRANQIFSIFRGQTNFHNYTSKKLYFDRSSQRRIDGIEISEPFIERDIEFCRITVKGESFMLHQIRKMIGFSLAVIRGVVGDDLLERSLTKEEFHTPMAPGLGLMLERLHYTQYANLYQKHDPLIFDEFDDAVEQFRKEVIHPVIVDTEIREHSMLEWLELLMVHSFHAKSENLEDERKFRRDSTYSDDWGESPEFLEKLKKFMNE